MPDLLAVLNSNFLQLGRRSLHEVRRISKEYGDELIIGYYYNYSITCYLTVMFVLRNVRPTARHASEYA